MHVVHKKNTFNSIAIVYAWCIDTMCQANRHIRLELELTFQMHDINQGWFKNSRNTKEELTAEYVEF